MFFFSLYTLVIAVAQFVFGKRLGCLHLESSNSEGQLFINEIQHLFALIQDLMYYPVKLFRYIPFKKWKELLNSQTSVCIQQIQVSFLS